MKVHFLPSACGPSVAPVQCSTSFLVNETVAIDAGCLGSFSDLDVQRKVEHIFLSHTHVDHLATLPLFLENVYTPDERCPSIHASETVMQTLRKDVFNNRVWPDFVALSRRCPPFLRLEHVEDGQTVEVNGLKISPVDVDHVVPTHGYVVDDGTSQIVFSSDTGPTDRIWEHANRCPNLKAVFLEASFPESMAWLAREAKHLTPRQFAAERQKVKHDAPFIAVHIKIATYDEVVKELQELAIPGLEIGTPGRIYEF